MPRLRAVSRWLRDRDHLSRRISRIVRMGNRSVAIVVSTGPHGPVGTMTDVVARRRVRDHDPVERVITMRGIGDHDPWNG
jgi:hypothetical protein